MNKPHNYNPFTSKIISGTEPLPVNDYSSGRLYNRSSPYMNYMMFTNTPYWQKLSGLKSLFDWFHSNPVFFATVMIKAREYANMRIKVVNRSTKLEEPETTRKTIPAKLYALFNKPNVMQSRWEFFMQRKIFEEVAGNSFTYGNFTLGFKPSYDTISALWNVWPAYMQFKLSGKFFEATSIDDVIKEWKFELGSYKKIWTPFEIMHKNKPNTEPMEGLIFGRAPAYSLIRPLTNIDMAYESRNVLMRNRGMRVILTSNKSDESGSISLNEGEKTDMQDAMGKYGMLENQNQFFFSPAPVSATPIDQDVFKLGLFEELATDAMMVANVFGVPEVLLKLYLKGATFENQEASVRRLYQGTLIPEAEDDMIALNSFLGLEDTEWMIVANFDHVAALQESKKTESEREKQEKETAMAEYGKGLITLEEYRERMGYGPLPKTETTQSAE